jgi:protein NRD1
MSKRVGPDNNPGKRQKDDRGRHGRKGGDRDRDNQQSYAYNQGPPPMDYGSYARPEPVAVATPPAVPGFGFTLGQPPYR